MQSNWLYNLANNPKLFTRSYCIPCQIPEINHIRSLLSLLVRTYLLTRTVKTLACTQVTTFQSRLDILVKDLNGAFPRHPIFSSLRFWLSIFPELAEMMTTRSHPPTHPPVDTRLWPEGRMQSANYARLGMANSRLEVWLVSRKLSLFFNLPLDYFSILNNRGKALSSN